MPTSANSTKDGSLVSRFSTSFAAFLTREDCRNLNRLVETEILDMAITACSDLKFGSDVRELLQSAARQMTKQAVDGTIRSIIEGIGATCESPLEVALALAIGIAARAKDYAVLFDFRGFQAAAAMPGQIR
jgi:hypothetical protein